MRRPNTFVVGAPKCGTTTISTCLGEHPQVFFSSPKELNYFNSDSPVAWRRRNLGGREISGEEQYLEHFAGAGAEHSVVAEGSAWYLCSRVALESIAAFSPEGRVVVMLRNPVEMAFSLHAENVASFHEDVRDLGAAWDLQAVRARGEAIPRRCLAPRHLQYLEACSLGTQLERAIAIFGRSRCHPIVLDDLAAAPREVWEALLRFLGLRDDGRASFPTTNERRQHRVAWLSLITLVRPPFWLLGGANRLKRTLGLPSLGLRPLVMRLNVRRRKPAPQSPAVRRRITAELAREITMLEELLGRDFSRWRTVDG